MNVFGKSDLATPILAITRALNRLSVRNKILVCFAIPIFIMIANTLSTYSNTQDLISSSKWVEHTHEVIARAHHLEKLIVDMETGERGFLITGNEDFLEPFVKSNEKWSPSVEFLKNLVSDNPPQVELITKIDNLKKDWIHLAAMPEIEQRRKVRPQSVSLDYIQNTLREKEGKQVLDKIRTMAQELSEIFVLSSAKESENILAQIMKDILDQETGQKGFLITGDDEFLEPYYMGNDNFKVHIGKLRTLVFASPNKQKIDSLLHSLRSTHESWITISAEPEIKIRSQHDNAFSQSNSDSDRKIYLILENNLIRAKGKSILEDTLNTLNKLDDIFKKSGNEKAQLFIADLYKSIVDQDTGKKGFLLTGRRDFLEPYYAGLDSFNQTLEELHKISNNTINKSEIIRRINEIESTFEHWKNNIAAKEISTRRELNVTEIDTFRLTQLLTEKIDQLKSEFDALLKDIEENSPIKNGTMDEQFQNVKTSLLATRNDLVGYFIFPNEKSKERIHLSTSNLIREISLIQSYLNTNPVDTLIDEPNIKLSLMTTNWINKISHAVSSYDEQSHTTDNPLKIIQNVVRSSLGKSIFDEMRLITDKIQKQFIVSGNLESSKLVIDAKRYIVDQETGQRGFLITGEESFLEPYIQGQKNLKETIARLNNIINSHYDKYLILDRIDQIADQAEEWRIEIAEPSIQLRTSVTIGNSPHSEIEQSVAEGLGKAALDSIRNTVRDTKRELEYSHDHSSAGILTKLLKSIVEQESGLRGYLITGREEFLEPYRNGLQEMNRHLLDLKTSIETSYDKDNMLVLLNDFSRTYSKWVSEAGEPEIKLRRKLNLTGASMNDVRALIERETGKNIIDQIRAKLEEFINHERMLIQIRISKANSAADSTLFKNLFGAFLAAFIAFLSAYVLARVILMRLSKLMEATQNVAEGDFTQSIKIDGKDEIYVLGESFNKMIAALRTSTESEKKSKEEMKKYSAELETKNKHIEENNKDLVQAHEKLAQQAEELTISNQYKSEFLATMSHEIRTPMNGVLGMLNLLKKSKHENETHRKIGIAHSCAQSLLTLINDILDFSKIEANKLNLEVLDFDLPSQLGDFADTMAIKAAEKNIEFILDVTEVEQGSVRGDPGRIRQILNNLVGNAIKFTSEGEVILKAKLEEIPEDGSFYLSCSIIDTGIGIAADKLDHIFESFTQEDASTTRKYGGTGLGLAIVKQLCQHMGGNVSVQSVSGRGSNFSFNVKLDSSEQIHCMPKLDITGAKVLIVDDNTSNRNVLKQQLELWNANVIEIDGNVDVFGPLETILDRGNEFDIAFIDDQMTSIGGIQLIKELSKKEQFENTKFILMTSTENQRIPERSSEFKLSMHFSKPATLEKLYRSFAVLFNGTDKFVETYSALSNLNLRTNSAQAQKVTIEFDNNKQILIVEDNPINQEVIRGIFEDYDLNAIFAFDGIEALDALKEAPQDFPIQFIFMDCQMPQMDGFETTNAIRKGQAGNNYRNIPIVAMTANAMKGDRERCINAGMNDYLSKPVDENQVILMLNNYLASADKPLENIDPGDIHLWNEEALLKRVRGKTDRAVVLINMFMENITEHCDNLKEAIDKEDKSEIASAAHIIRGIAGNLGCTRLFEHMTEIETSSNDDNLDQVHLLNTQTDTLVEKSIDRLSAGKQKFSN